MTVTTNPSVPIAGSAATLSMTSATGTKYGFEVKSRPSKSTVALGLHVTPPKDDASGLPVASPLDGAERGRLATSITFDVPGEYVLVGYDMRERIALPSFPGDVTERGFDLLAKQETTVMVAGYVTLPIRTQLGEGADVQLLVQDETIQVASLINHTSELARVAALDSTTVGALAALVGVGTSSVGPSVDAALTELRAKYEAHRVFAITIGTEPHSVPDNTNAANPTESFSRGGSIELFNALRRAILAHMEDGSKAATSWHSTAAPVNHDDLKNLPATGPAGTLDDLTVGLADLRYRVYNRHRAQVANPASHQHADATNTISASSKLEDVIVAYLDALVAENPSVAAGEPEGIHDLRHLYGFR